MKKSLIVSGGIVIILLGAVVFGLTSGISEGSILTDALESQQVPREYFSRLDHTADVQAILFYDEHLQDHIFSIYTLSNPLFKRYRFKLGGSSSQIQDQYEIKSVNGYHVIMSMNKDRITKMVIEGNGKKEQVSVKPDRPFVHVFDDDMLITSLINDNGDEVIYTISE